MLGIADALSFWCAKILAVKYETPKVLRILLSGIIVGCVLFLIITPYFESLIPLFIVIIRMNSSSVLNFGYHINSYLFPVLLRGNVYAITNSVSRPFNAVATITVEYTT